MKQFFHLFIIGMVLKSSALLAQPASFFTVDTEGWTAKCECVSDPSSSWATGAGTPGGAYKGTDNNANFWWYFNSPPAFNIDLSSYYNYCLTFDMKCNKSTFPNTTQPDIMLVKGDGTKIVYNLTPNPPNSWTHYSVPLYETGWQYTSLGGAAVTYTDFIDFLTNFAVIKIRGDYTTNDDESTWIDNVIICTVPLLPIELASFSGNVEVNNTAILSWETLSELNCNHFEIEKVAESGVGFEMIGRVDANGTTTEKNNYTFYDDDWKHNSYYRLKIVDNDNSFTYSKVITVGGNSLMTQDINVYPNPVNTTLELENVYSNTTFTSVKIMDIYGRVVKNFATAQSTGSFTYDVSDIANGFYILHLQDGTQNLSIKFEIMH